MVTLHWVLSAVDYTVEVVASVVTYTCGKCCGVLILRGELGSAQQSIPCDGGTGGGGTQCLGLVRTRLCWLYLSFPLKPSGLEPLWCDGSSSNPSPRYFKHNLILCRTLMRRLTRLAHFLFEFQIQSVPHDTTAPTKPVSTVWGCHGSRNCTSSLVQVSGWTLLGAEGRDRCLDTDGLLVTGCGYRGSLTPQSGADAF